jgi:Zn-dependent peptidase ImmA (M78 family)
MRSTARTFDRLLEIEERARALQKNVYRQRYELWEANPPLNVVDVFEPGIGLQYVGYTITSVHSLGQILVDNIRSEVSGQIDNLSKSVVISENFSAAIKRFTAAHELGHALLHPDVKVLHRDIPLERSVVTNWREREANRFASAYLMPRKLVEERFTQCFEMQKFKLTDGSAFALCGTNIATVQKCYRDPRQLSQCVASTPHFDGRYFKPLNEQFKVSAPAMAIRLEELELLPKSAFGE